MVGWRRPDPQHHRVRLDDLYRDLQPRADVGIQKTGVLSADGTQLVYQLQVSNTGPSPAADVTVTDALAGKLTFVSATSTKGSCPRVGKYPDVHRRCR